MLDFWKFELNLHIIKQLSPQVRGTDSVFNMRIEQRIEYEGCAANANDPETRIMRFKSSKDYVSYDPNDQVSNRFECAVQSK